MEPQNDYKKFGGQWRAALKKSQVIVIEIGFYIFHLK